jgi:hypothetical protein
MVRATTTSPFRSCILAERENAADQIIANREAELDLLDKKWQREKKAAKQRQLMTRIQATRNHIRGWQDYIEQGCPRVANATTLV